MHKTNNTLRSLKGGVRTSQISVSADSARLVMSFSFHPESRQDGWEPSGIRLWRIPEAEVIDDGLAGEKAMVQAGPARAAH